MKILIATANRHKFQEISAILSRPGLELVNLSEVPNAPQVIEDGETFEANAIKKAVTLAAFTGLWTLADDSGLEVDALEGAPGVYSARYAGEPSNDAANNRKLISALKGNPNRRARFRCCIALSDPQGQVRTVSGACEGHLLEELKGNKGFGYDPLFVPDGFSNTFAEIPESKKNTLSHRAKALTAAVAGWSELLSQRQ